MFSKSLSIVLTLTMFLVTTMAIAHTPPQHAKVYFIEMEEGAVVQSPFMVKFGIQGFGITPAGTKDKRRHTAGHHHLLVDMEQLPDLDEAIPQDARHIHFDQGETEALLELAPGRHTLQLLLGDEQHEPQDPPLYSDKITIIVE